MSTLGADDYVSACSSYCSACKKHAPKNGSWLLDDPMRVVCSACLMWADDSHAEEQIRRGYAHPTRPWKPEQHAHMPVTVRFLARRRYALLATEPGGMKTAASLYAVPPGSPVVALTPKSVALEWYDEAAQWRPDLHPHRAARGSVAWPGPGTFVASNYEAIPDGLPHPGTVFLLDEAHLKIKNPGAELTQRVRALVRWAVTHGGRCYVITGTPYVNSPDDLWELLETCLMGHACYGESKSYGELFACYYEAKSREDRETPGEEERLEIQRLIQRALVRHLVKSKLPPKTKKTVPVEIEPDDAKVIHEHVRRLVAAKRVNAEVKAGVLPDPRERGLRPEQKAHRKERWRAHFELVLANLTNPDEGEIAEAVDLALKHAGSTPAFEEFALVRSALATAKIRAAFQLADQLEAQGEAPLFFCCHLAPIEALASRPGWAKITGGESTKKRKQYKDSFQRGELKGLGIATRAGGTGLTLTHAAHEVFVDLDPTSVANVQASKRAHRMGQTREVTEWHLTANHALDRRMIEINEEKEAMIDELFGKIDLADGDELWWPGREAAAAVIRACQTYEVK